MTVLRLALLTLPLAACTTSSADSVVGTWRELPNALDETQPAVADRPVLTFAADGTYQHTAPGSTSTGTYAIDDGRITLTSPGDAGSSHVFELPVLVDADRFMFGSLEADDDGADPVATWSGYSVSDGVRLDTSVALDGDGSAHMIQTQGATAPATYDGTWEASGADVAETFVLDSGGGTVTLHLHGTLYGGVLGEPYERIE